MRRQNVGLAKHLRRAQADAERKLWMELRARQIGWKWRRQHALGSYIVDFVCLQASLVVELDGSQHMEHSQADARRTAFLELEGFRVLRFWDDDVLLKTESVLEAIWNALESPPSPNPLPVGERA